MSDQYQVIQVVQEHLEISLHHLCRILGSLRLNVKGQGGPCLPTVHDHGFHLALLVCMAKTFYSVLQRVTLQVNVREAFKWVS